MTQFPVKEISFTVPKWLAMQSRDFAPKAEIMERIKENFSDITKISEIVPAAEKLPDGKFLKTAKCDGIDYGTGCAEVKVDIDKDLYYDTLRDMTGRDVKDDWALMQLIDELVFAKREYDKIAPALQQVEKEGYGIVMPGRDKLQLMEPEIVKQGSKYGIKLTAAAPSLHILRANITTTVSPIIADETNGEDMVNSMMKNFENNPLEIWQSNLFGNSLQELVNRGEQQTAKYPTAGKRKTCGNRGKGGKRRLPRAYLHNTIKNKIPAFQSEFFFFCTLAIKICFSRRVSCFIRYSLFSARLLSGQGSR